LRRVVWQTITDVSEVLAASIIIALMMEAASTSETSVNFYQTTRCYNPEYLQKREVFSNHVQQQIQHRLFDGDGQNFTCHCSPTVKLFLGPRKLFFSIQQYV
jgi:hypothetical protein